MRMAHPVPFPIGAEEGVEVSAPAIPWYIWCLVAATTSAVIGGVWDISWHKSIGRDSFWTPAHILIYLCGVMSGFGSGYLILAATFDRASSLGEASVRMWGFRGPLGAFLCAWGGAAMLASAPFDDWWHNAYGLDVKVLSPPHVVLILGIVVIRVGTLVLIAGCRNRASGPLGTRLEWMLLFVGTLLMGGTIGAFLEWITRNHMHGARFYIVVSLVIPLLLMAVTRASSHRWAATIVGSIFTTLALAFLWILPMFPAEPKLGPVYYRVTHFIPNDFPLLILPACVAVDLVRHRLAGLGRWRQALILGPVFLAVFAAAQWPFADFLMTPASRNWFFGTHYIPFFVPPETDYARNVFSTAGQTAGSLAFGMACAFAAAIVSTRLGLGWGDWMGRLRR